MKVDIPVVNERNDELFEGDLKADDDIYMFDTINPAQFEQILSISPSQHSNSPSVLLDNASPQQLSQYIQRVQQDKSVMSSRATNTNFESTALPETNIYSNDRAIDIGEQWAATTHHAHPKFNSNEPLPPPFVNKHVWSGLIYVYQTVIATNPRNFSLLSLYRAIWPRTLACIDLYTDGVVTYQLYTSNEIVLFTLSFAFILLPFVVVWSVSLRFLQKFVNRMSKDKKWITYFVLLYLFPPIGCIIVTTYEIVWVVYEFFKGLLYFCGKTTLILDKDSTTESVKSYYNI